MNEQERAAYRAFVREHHPDRGGEPEAFIAGLARFRAGTTPAGTPDTGPGGTGALPFPVRVGVALIRTWRHLQRSRRTG